MVQNRREDELMNEQDVGSRVVAAREGELRDSVKL